MRFPDEGLRDKLAAEYVLGTMSARARRRFEIHLRGNPQLRRAVAQWETRLAPLTDALPAIEPPARVWQAIKARLKIGQPVRSGFWESLSFWRVSSFASGLLALALIVMVALPKPETPVDAGRMVVIMNDLATQKPAMTASWEPGQRGSRTLRIRVIGHAEMGPNTAWELWMLPDGDQKPVSLGLITTHETQVVKIPGALAVKLDAAHGLAMSVEPAGGSPTGLPTGPVLYAGECIKI
ncbi:MAG: anti-sigma factor [Betaproteobacteria bacterium]|nr:anti-sigma factor [Betaproteobacteria bacterium]